MSTDLNFFSPDYFASSSCKLRVWAGFGMYILPAYSNGISKRGLQYAKKAMELPEPMSDSEIFIYFGGEDVVKKRSFTPDQVADLFDLQANGNEGLLQNNGGGTLLYIIGIDGIIFPLYTYWNSREREWNVYVFRKDTSGKWPAGYRVLQNHIGEV